MPQTSVHVVILRCLQRPRTPQRKPSPPAAGALHEGGAAQGLSGDDVAPNISGVCMKTLKDAWDRRVTGPWWGVSCIWFLLNAATPPSADVAMLGLCRDGLTRRLCFRLRSLWRWIGCHGLVMCLQKGSDFEPKGCGAIVRANRLRPWSLLSSPSSSSNSRSFNSRFVSRSFNSRFSSSMMGPGIKKQKYC